MSAHLLVAPIVLPLIVAVAMVLLGDGHRRAKAVLNVLATGVGLVVAIELLRRIGAPGQMAPAVYLAANWEAPFGIVLVADALSALMLTLAAVVALGTALYAEAGWSRMGTHFHALFQIQLMGLNGAFLTGDLFNLFVFFELMLAASYGLQLHGSGWPRVRSGLHYIAVNLLASSLFLIGLAMLYGVTGTLSMADIAHKLPQIASSDRGLLHAGLAILAVAFLTKAAMWPLNAWLVPTYAASSAPVAALFALMTKVGVYVLLRLSTLFFAAAGDSGHFGAPVMIVGGLATLGVGTIGLMSSTQLRRIAGHSIVVSSGILLVALGMGSAAVTSAALFYMLSATLAVSALFLIAELIERVGTTGRAPHLAHVELDEDTNLDDDEAPVVGRLFPVSLALLGVAFMICSLLVAGLPPLSGFLAKVALLRFALMDDAGDFSRTFVPWVFMALLLASSLAATITLARVGMRQFWSRDAHAAPRVKVAEAVSVSMLLLCTLALSVDAERVLGYTRAAAASLHAPQAYVGTVLTTQPRPGPTRPSVLGENAP